MITAIFSFSISVENEILSLLDTKIGRYANFMAISIAEKGCRFSENRYIAPKLLMTMYNSIVFMACIPMEITPP